MIYLDHAATTQMLPEVYRAMYPYLSKEYGNPSSNYELSSNCKLLLYEARQSISQALHCNPSEIYFTSCGTESDNWAIQGIVDALKRKGNHIISTQIEHHAVLKTLKHLEQKGCQVTLLPVNQAGEINPTQLQNAITKETILVTIMYANNEIGTIQPIDQIQEICHQNKVYFHTDAVQAYGQIPIHLDHFQIHMLSASAHKFNGPKGCGFLYIKEHTPIKSYLFGGGQEKGLRAGTENVAAIAGMKKASELCHTNLPMRMQKEMRLRDYFIRRILSEIPKSKLNGSAINRLPNNINICFENVPAASLLSLLDSKGIYASGGSACNSSSTEPSHVLTAIGLSKEEAESSIRFTLGFENTREQINYTIYWLKKFVAQLRNS